MSKRKYKRGLLLDHDGGHLGYKIGEAIQLYHSKLGNWSDKVKGKRTLLLKDKGNDFRVTFYGHEDIIIFDIGQLGDLYTALKLLDKQKTNLFCKYQEVRRVKKA